jgi:hypothetical protein
VKELDDDIIRFRASKKEAIFTLFLGVVNHWITLIVQKSLDGSLKFYLLDSSNIVFLDKTDEQLPEVMEHRERERCKIINKPTLPFTIKMSIQSIFD